MTSVLLPTYNQSAFLMEALVALGRQTYRDYELIACDDGSTDGTAGILQACGVRAVTHEQNLGAAAAINAAAALASPDAAYMTWVSSDNVMHPDWLATLASELDARPDVGAVYSAYDVCEAGAKRPRRVRQGPYRADALIASENCYFGPSFLIRREVWQEHRGGTAHDYDSWARVEEACLAKGLTLQYVDQALCDYRAGPWCTARARPDLYDAPRWRDEALLRRSTSPNWLGALVAALVRITDEVLDLGCGIMPATGGRLICRKHVGVDCFAPYLVRIGPPTIHGRLPEAAEQFGPRSFDVVLLLDVVEHLNKPDALALIAAAERIASREVVLFTPDGYCQQDGAAQWGMAHNEAMAHKCEFAFDELVGMGYACSRHPNETAQQGQIMSVLGIKQCGSPSSPPSAPATSR